MRQTLLALAAVSAFVSTAAIAQDAAAPKAGTMLVTADGKRLGRIESINNDRSGQPASASVILNSQFVRVPLSTVTAGENGRAVTSLSRKEVAALR